MDIVNATITEATFKQVIPEGDFDGMNLIHDPRPGHQISFVNAHELEAELDSAYNAVDDYKGELNDLEREAGNLETELEDAREEIAAYRERIAELEAELAE